MAVRALVLTGVMKAAEELRDRAAAVRKRDDFMVMVCVCCQLLDFVSLIISTLKKNNLSQPQTQNAESTVHDSES